MTIWKKWGIIAIAGLLVLGALTYLSAPRLVKYALSITPESQTPDQKRTLATLEKINDHPFYRMNYYGGYSQFLELKQKYRWAFGLPKPECTGFSALSAGGDSILAYNSDGEHRPLLLLFTAPPDGYASISVVDIGENFGFDEKHTPFDSERLKSLLLYAPYYANTGMNEMGLAFGVMADIDGKSSIDPAKETTFASEIRRYVLDSASNVDEAVALLSSYNVSYEGTTASRILLVDRSRRSAIVEWVDGTIRVTHNQEPWQVSTNTRVYGADQEIAQYTGEYEASGSISEDINGRSYWRYLTAWKALEGTQGRLSMEQSMDLLSTVSLTVAPDVWWPTQYSVVYDLSTGEVRIATDREYELIYEFQLPMRMEH